MYSVFSIPLGSFQEDKDHPAARFLRVANTMEEDMTSSDCGKFDWPRYGVLYVSCFVHGRSMDPYW